MTIGSWEPRTLTGRVFITGGAGFLARAIYRRAEAEGWDAEFTCFSRDDSKHVQLQRKFPNVNCIRGDVAGDPDLLAAAMRGHDLVIHAAAVKYVDLAETNVFDTIRVNVHGSEQVANAAERAGVGRVIAISTDKACAPANLYGATKMVMERIMIEADRRAGGTRFVNVRYGNVVGSTGSVIPKLREQARLTGEITITDPAMTRFWMAADAAVDTILRAVSAIPGETVIPAPKAMKMEQVVAAIGIFPSPRVVTIGLRPGEKLHEQLITFEESVRTYHDPEGPFWMLRAPGLRGAPAPPPGMHSAAPEGGWMGFEEMERLIADAETI